MGTLAPSLPWPCAAVLALLAAIAAFWSLALIVLGRRTRST